MDKHTDNEKDIKKIQLALTNKHMDQFRQLFLDEHPYIQAQFFIKQDEESRQLIYAHLSAEEVALFMEDIDHEDTKTFIMEMDTPFAASVLAEMPADDAVDILNELDKEVVVSFLTIMDEQAADEIKQLLHYEEKTAGSIMTTEFVSLIKSQTAKQAMARIKEIAPDAETIYYMYVEDANKRLVGVLSLRELIVANEETLMEEIMDDNLISVSVGADQEEVARMMRDYDFLALPVVDFQNHLLGIITVDDILDVMDEEASDDYSKLAAISDVQKPDDSAIVAAKKRLPWLIILLFLGMLTASLIGQFEETLEQVALLAIFIPLIAGMAGNTGTQSLAVAVRGLATGDFGQQGKLKLLLREATTGLITGSVCGLLIAIIIFVWKGEIFLGILVGFAILTTLIVATLSGSIIPIIMDRLKIDPAVASGPFITTINDIISILIYFGFATAFMKYLI
ncbi:magnesium transporter [Ornithinibacillus sp. 4-3]|uniref:Magnesium transporter MgtE n=1 Tax=Ornithinibacillus sp. 4-3 TaxID=3231488 RepID=A0AB39HVX0_9BACI